MERNWMLPHASALRSRKHPPGCCDGVSACGRAVASDDYKLRLAVVVKYFAVQSLLAPPAYATFLCPALISLSRNPADFITLALVAFFICLSAAVVSRFVF